MKQELDKLYYDMQYGGTQTTDTMDRIYRKHSVRVKRVVYKIIK